MLAMLAASAPAEMGGLPGDARLLNEFAAEYNRYVGLLAQGRNDLKQWQRVLKAWVALTW